MIIFIGLIAWFLFSCWLTLFSFGGFIATNYIGGSLDKWDIVFYLVVMGLTVYNWYLFFGSFDIKVTA